MSLASYIMVGCGGWCDVLFAGRMRIVLLDVGCPCWAAGPRTGTLASMACDAVGGCGSPALVMPVSGSPLLSQSGLRLLRLLLQDGRKGCRGNAGTRALNCRIDDVFESENAEWTC